jgi:site-specific DNA recombinase
MKIGIYARVSTQKQADKGISIKDQIRRGVEFCEKNNFEFEVFSDEGYSGELPIEKRPALTNLFEKIFQKKKEIDGVFVVDFDRLTRNQRESIIIREIFIENDITLYELNGEINLKDPAQELLVGIKSLLGSFERKKTIVRIKRTFETSALEGKVFGGKLVKYGYKRDANKLLIIENEEAKIVKLIFKLSLEGLGTKRIAEELNKRNIPTKRMNLGGAKMMVRGIEKKTFIWRDSVIYNILINPIYKGERHFKEHVISCPAIIDESVFEAVQKSLKTRTSFKNTTNKYFYLLKGLLFCAKCNSKFYGRKREDLSDNQYICLSQRYKREFCKTRGINITKIENWVWESLLNLPKDLKYALEKRIDEKQKTNRGKSIELITSEIEELQKEGERILEVFKKEDTSKNRFARKRLNEIEIEINQFEKHIKKLEGDNIKSEQEEEIIKFLEDKISPIKDGKKLSNEEKQSIVRALIEKIKIQWDDENSCHRIQIKYKFDKHSEILLTKNLTLTYRKMGYSLRAKKFDEDVKIEIVSPSLRKNIKESNTRDFFIIHEKNNNKN